MKPLLFSALIAIFSVCSPALAEGYTPQLRSAMMQECFLKLKIDDMNNIEPSRVEMALTPGCDCIVQSYVDHIPAEAVLVRYETAQNLLSDEKLNRTVPREVQRNCLKVLQDGIMQEMTKP